MSLSLWVGVKNSSLNRSQGRKIYAGMALHLVTSIIKCIAESDFGGRAILRQGYPTKSSMKLEHIPMQFYFDGQALITIGRSAAKCGRRIPELEVRWTG
jgi:hypothetical protein